MHEAEEEEAVSFMNRKGQNMNMLTGAAIGLVVLVAVLGLSVNMFADQESDADCDDDYYRNYSLTYPDQCAYVNTNGSCANCSAEISGTAQSYYDGTSGVSNISGKVALIASVIIMVFIIGLLMFLRGRS